MTCTSCGHDNPPGARFCNECGAPLEEAKPDLRSYTPDHLVEKIRSGGRSLEGERKQVTVMFADVMGSMELAERTDPEEWRRIMDRFFAILCDGVNRFEGTVDKFTGDGIMALFGAPIAHEDHARRACFAALHLSDELARYAGELRRAQGLNFTVRMGLNSGEVVVGGIGDDLEMSYTALGHTVGLAQRMEQLAEPGRAYLTQHAAGLVEGYLELRDLGEFDVKGVSEPLRVFELAGVGTARGRLDVARARGFSRFVGREEEMARLEEALQSSQGGDGRAISVVGEPGVGKSRLCYEFVERCRARGIPVYEAQAQAHGKTVPFLPALQLVRAYYGITTEDSDRAAREKIAGRLLLLDPGFADDLPLIFDFVGVPDPERPVPRMDPDARQRRLFDIIERLVQTSSEAEPGVNVLEDLHWIDPGSDLLLGKLIEATAGTRSLIVANFRPEYRADWMGVDHHQQIELVPLGPEAIEELLTDLLGDDPSLAEVRDLVRKRTGGNPFFIEEVVQSLVEAAHLEGERGSYRLVRPIEEEKVPASVQAVLAARIDRLGEREKGILQTASVIGRDFSEPVLQKVAGLEPDDLDAGLRGLVAAEFLFQQELYPEAIYAFKHPLTQEVAYGSQLSERRARVHGAVAEAIAALYPDRLDEQAALLAQHWESAGEDLQAARWHARSAAWSGTSDPAASVRHWRRVRELADALPEDAETALLGATARIWMLQFGWRLGIEESEADVLFEEAEALTRRTSDLRSRASLLSVYATVKGISGRLTCDEHVTMTLEAIALAEEAEDKPLFVAISIAPAFALMQAGRYRESIELVDRAIELAGDDHTMGAGVSVGCPYAWCVMWKGVNLTYLGEFEEAERLIDQGMELARANGDLETAGWGYEMRVWIYTNRGDSDRALADGKQGFEIAERLGDSFSRIWSRFWLGQAHWLRKEWEQAIDVIEESDAMSLELRTAILGRSPRLATLAQCYLETGALDRALERAREAVEIAEAQNSGAALPYSRLMLARVLCAKEGASAADEAEALLRQAIEVAQETGYRAAIPNIHWRLGEVANLRGDEEASQRELGEAHRLFSEIGAVDYAREVESEMAAVTG